jgi:hypothetical protein
LDVQELNRCVYVDEWMFWRYVRGKEGGLEEDSSMEWDGRNFDGLDASVYSAPRSRHCCQTPKWARAMEGQHFCMTTFVSKAH